VNKLLQKPALSPNKHLRHDLFLNARPLLNKALHPNRAEEPSFKKAKTSVAPLLKLERFLKRGAVRGKIVKVGYFREQGLEVFLDKLKAQGWLDLVTNIPLGCSQPDLEEFYANVTVSEGLLTSTINGVLIEVDVRAPRVIMGVPATGFDLYVQEAKSLLGKAKLL